MVRRFLGRLYPFFGYLAGLFLIAIFILMMLLSAGRMLGLNVPSEDDFVAWCRGPEGRHNGGLCPSSQY